MNVAIIAAAGQGTRMAGSRPKQFLELAGTPILVHTLKVFELCEVIQEIVLVVAAEQSATVGDFAERYGLGKKLQIVAGGLTRAESVLKGLQTVREDAEIVVVHDGVRPFVTSGEISATVESALLNGAAILVAKPVDTVKEVKNGNVVRTLNRENLRVALTPQSFRYDLLRRAYEKVDVLDPELTDESSIVERLGVAIAVIEGSSQNIKITTAADLILAEAILRNRA